MGNVVIQSPGSALFAVSSEMDPWEVFDRLDDDMSGTISKSDFKRSLRAMCAKRGYVSLTKNRSIEEDADALWDAVDASGRGIVDASEWSALVALAERRRRVGRRRSVTVDSEDDHSSPPPPQILEVAGPGAIVRQEASLKSPRLCTLEPGTLVQERGRDTAHDGTERINISWGEENTGWISAKTVVVACLESASWTDWVRWLGDQTAAASPSRRFDAANDDDDDDDDDPSTSWSTLATANTLERRKNSTALLTGNLKFLSDFDQNRQNHLSTSLREVLRRSSSCVWDVEASLKELLEGKLDALSLAERTSVREALLGAEGVAWRRRQEAAVAERLDVAVKSLCLDDGIKSEEDEMTTRRYRQRGRLARALHAAGLAVDADPGSVSTSLVKSAAARLKTLSGSQILALTRWASVDEMLHHPDCLAWFEARDSSTVPHVVPPPSSSFFRQRPAAAAVSKTTTRSALLTCVSVAVRDVALSGRNTSDSDAIQAAVIDRYSRISKPLFAVQLGPVGRVWAISDLHVDSTDNKLHVASFVPHPEDALIVAGDVAPSLPLFEEVMASLVEKFKVVFFCPGNHDLWVQKSDHQTSLDKFFELFCICDKLGVVTYPARLENILVVPLFSWYTPEFVSASQEDGDLGKKLRFFDASCAWPDFLSSSSKPSPKKPRPSRRGERRRHHLVVDGVVCSTNSLDPGISRFFRKLNQPALEALQGIDREKLLCISFSHFVPHTTLFEGLGGVHFLGHTMGDSSIADDVKAIDSRAHVFGHSHLNVDAVIDDVRYIQNAIGHKDAGQVNALPVVVWDSHFEAPVPSSSGRSQAAAREESHTTTEPCSNDPPPAPP